MKLSHNNGKLTYFPHFFCKTSLIPSAILASMFVSSIPLHSCGLWHIPPYFRWWLPRSQVLQVTWYIPPILCQMQICLWFDRFNPKVLQVKLSKCLAWPAIFSVETLIRDEILPSLFMKPLILAEIPIFFPGELPRDFGHCCESAGGLSLCDLANADLQRPWPWRQILGII